MRGFGFRRLDVLAIEGGLGGVDAADEHRFVDVGRLGHFVVHAMDDVVSDHFDRKEGKKVGELCYLMLWSSGRSGIPPSSRGNSRALCGRYCSFFSTLPAKPPLILGLSLYFGEPWRLE